MIMNGTRKDNIQSDNPVIETKASYILAHLMLQFPNAQMCAQNLSNWETRKFNVEYQVVQKRIEGDNGMQVI